MQDKVSFEERKKQEGVSYVTSKFDKQEKRLDGLMSMVLLRRKKDNQYKQEQSQAILLLMKIKQEKIKNGK